MRVVVVGAGGFIGTRLVAQLAAAGQIAGRPIAELVLLDVRAARPPAAPACAVSVLAGDLRDGATLDAVFERPVDVLVHLAATLTVDAETDFGRGLDTNVRGFIALLERCRAQGGAPLLLFASSIATFGGALPEAVGDDVFQAPATSYGTHKAIAELLLSDYSRHGFVDGRCLRLPIVLTHPGPASGSISDQLAALIREPLRGRRTVCRMARDGLLVAASVDRVVEGFMRLAALPAPALQASRAMNLPGLTVTPGQIAQAVARRLPPGTPDPVDWRPDPAVQQIIDSWPKAFTSARALALGFTPDASADALVQSFLAQERSAP